ncbi:MAG: carbohydrate ABC transporter permease, partial [Paracoccaceae bacterium]|nr:carbohydrate ABC transporter permease [Paracoccaceae bacterium]
MKITFPDKKKWRLYKENFLYIIMMLLGVIMLVPLIWVILTAFKTEPEISKLPITWLPDSFLNFDNFVQMFSEQPFGRYFLNSVTVAVISLISSTAIAVLAGYAFAKIEFKFKEFFFILILSVFMIPAEVMVLPKYLMMSQIGWVNSYLGLAFPDLFTAFGVYLFRQFMSGIPDTYIDAARIDGASEIKILWHVILPLVKPALAAFIIIKFMFSWNQFLWPLVIGQKQDMFTVTVGLVAFSGQWYNQWNLIAAATVLSIIPMLL